MKWIPRYVHTSMKAATSESSTSALLSFRTFRGQVALSTGNQRRDRAGRDRMESIGVDED